MNSQRVCRTGGNATLRALAILSFVAALGGYANAAELPTADALNEKIATAAGVEPASRYVQVRYRRSGVDGTETRVYAGENFRENDEYGPLRTAYGRFENQEWHQTANGQTVLDQPDPGQAVADVFVTTVSRVTAPFDAYVIARLNNDRSGTKDYVDPVAYRVVRHENITPTETTVTTYDDFRAVGGYTTAWHWSRRDGHAENNADYTLTAYEARPIAAAEIAIAAPRRNVVQFPAGKERVDLPVKMVGDKFVVRAVINGRGLDLELDSGASVIAIDDKVVRQLGLTTVSHFSNAANAGRVGTTLAIAPEIHVGDLEMHDVTLVSLPAVDERGDDVRIAGYLGFDFIAELGLELDYEHGRVTALRLDKPLTIDEPGTFRLDIRLGTQRPMTSVTINNALGERFLIDTGADGTLLIFDYFARRYPHSLVDGGGGGDERRAHLSGIGGPIEVRPYQLDQVQIGSVRFQNFVGYRVLERRAYNGTTDGLIGARLLRYFTVWLDYTDSQVFLVPNADGRRAMRLAVSKSVAPAPP